MSQEDILKQKRKSHLAKAEAIVAAAQEQPGGLTTEQDAQYHEAMAAISRIDSRLQATSDMQATIDSMTTSEPDPDFVGVYDKVSGRNRTSQPRLIESPLTAFKGPEATRNAYDASLFVRACIMGDATAKDKLESRRPAWLASMSTVNPTAGGYSVPPEFHRAIIEYRNEVGVARKLATVLPMGSDNLSVPKLDSGPTTYVVGEESQITSSDMSFSQITLQPKKRACLSYISTELNDDNGVGLSDLLAQRMGLSLATQEDLEFVSGDGTSSYGGITGCKTIFSTATAGVVAAATNNDTWPEIIYADVAKAMAAVASKYRTGGELAFLCSTSAKWQVLDRLCLSQGGAVAANMANGLGVNSFAGYPVYTNDNMPTTTAANTIFLLFGNFKLSSLFGDRQELRIMASPHIKFDYDQIALRATVRYDIIHHEFGDASTAGGVVALKTAS